MTFAVVTYSSQPDHPGIAILKRSLAKWGWPELRVFGKPDPSFQGQIRKVQCLRDEIIPAMRAERINNIVFVDAFDTVVCGPPCSRFDNHILLMSTEIKCWPLPELSYLFPPLRNKNPWRFLNSGGYVGSIGSLEDMLMTIDCNDPRYVWGSDQLWFTDLLLKGNSGINLDVNCEYFQTLAGCEPWQDYFEVLPDGRVRNKLTGTCPAIWHGNSRSDMGFLPGCDDWKKTWSE